MKRQVVSVHIHSCGPSIEDQLAFHNKMVESFNEIQRNGWIPEIHNLSNAAMPGFFVVIISYDFS